MQPILSRTPFSRHWLIYALIVVATTFPKYSQALETTFGTGFIVSDEGYIVTAWHVIKDKEQVFVGPISENKWAKATVIKTDTEKDLALLKGPKLGSPVQIGDWASVPIGLEIFAIGYPSPRTMGLSKKITQGIINGSRLDKENLEIFQFSAEIQQGNSGGALFAPDGSVVGVAQRKLDALKVAERSHDLPQNVNFALKSSSLIEFLRSTDVKAHIRAVDLNVTARPFEVFHRVENSVIAILAAKKPETHLTP